MPDNPPSTPILDLKAPLPRPIGDGFRLQTYLAPIAVLAFLVCIGESETLIVPLGLVVTTLGVIAVHELGHILVGVSVGFRFESVAIGPVWIRRESGRLRLRPRGHIFGGLTYMSLDRVRRVRRRLIWLVLGGPVASLTVGIVAIGTAQLIAVRDDSIWPFALKFFGGYSLLIGMLSILPKKSGLYAGDGLLLRTLLCSKDGTKQWIFSHAVNMLKNDGVDPLLWNQRWLRAASARTEISYTNFSAHWREYETAIGEAAAAQCLERCLADSASLDPSGRDELILEATFFTAWRRGDAERATLWLKRLVHPQLTRPIDRIRVEIAIDCARREIGDALKKWEEGLAVLSGIGPGGSVEKVRASWLAWRNDIQGMEDTVHRNELETANLHR